MLTRPLDETVATSVFEDCQVAVVVTVRSVLSDNLAVATSWLVSEMPVNAEPPLKTSDRTVTVGLGADGAVGPVPLDSWDPHPAVAVNARAMAESTVAPLLANARKTQLCAPPNAVERTDAASPCIANDLDGASPTPWAGARQRLTLGCLEWLWRGAKALARYDVRQAGALTKARRGSVHGARIRI